MRQPAVILDRDGTINREQSFVTAPDQLVLLPGVVPAMRRLAAAGYLLIVVTNQSGIARGLYSETGLARIHETLHTALDGLPRAWLHCPHHPDPEFAGSGYGRLCACRKPSPGMLTQAAALFPIDWSRSWLVGDTARDLRMGVDLPAGRILVQSGKPWQPQLADLREAGCEPHAIVADLAAAVGHILDSPEPRAIS